MHQISLKMLRSHCKTVKDSKTQKSSNNSWRGEIYFLSIALILAFGTLQTTGTVLNTDKPVASVVSCSMYPGPDEQGLYKGDILVVQGTTFEQIQEGDTVVYQVPDRMDFSIAGQDYSLEKSDSNSRPSTDTSIGEVKLIRAARGKEDRPDKALIEVNGERNTVIEGKSYRFENMNMDVSKISTMPIPVVHKVIRKYEDSLETKGINNPGQLDFEKDVRPEQIHGKVKFTVPRVGLIKIVAMDLIGFNGGTPLTLENSKGCEVKA